VQESARRVLAFKSKKARGRGPRSTSLRAGPRHTVPTAARIEKLTRQLWEFGEEIRLATLACADNEAGNKKKKERA
jgi:hypothetical protein